MTDETFDDFENELDALADLVVSELARWEEGDHCVHNNDSFNGRRGLSLRAGRALIDAVVFGGAEEDEAAAALESWRFHETRSIRIITMTKDEVDELAEKRRTIFNG